MKVSIAMATYNGEKFLQEQLDSFIAQTRQPDELVVCDDGSSDSTVEILRRFSAGAPFEVRIYANEKNLGYVKNFEKALSLCSGDIVFLSDQDDAWFPEKVYTMVEELISNTDTYLIRSDMILTNEKLNPSGISQLENMLSLGSKESDFNFGCGMAFRKEWLSIVLPIPCSLWGHDRWLGKLAHAVGVSGLIRQPLMYYRRHEVNASTSLASETRELSMIDVLKAHGLKDASKGWKDEVSRLEDIKSRINEREVQLFKIAGEDNVRQALKLLCLQQENLKQRIGLASRSRFVRFPVVAGFWLKGGYRQFAGWRSAVKDLIRP